MFTITTAFKISLKSAKGNIEVSEEVACRPHWIIFHLFISTTLCLEVTAFQGGWKAEMSSGPKPKQLPKFFIGIQKRNLRVESPEPAEQFLQLSRYLVMYGWVGNTSTRLLVYSYVQPVIGSSSELEHVLN